jgi:hypothetical protein
VNRDFQWAVIEAANTSCRVRRRDPHRHVSQLYDRLARPKGHQKAVGAVARHLAEAAYGMLTKRAPYREPPGPQAQGSSREASARAGELSASTLEVMKATRLRKTCMRLDSEERPLATPARRARGKISLLSLFLHGAFRDAPHV